MTESSFNFSAEGQVAFSTERSRREQDVQHASLRQVGHPDRRTLKVLFANKFLFRNGGSEVVMFDEMELMRRRNVDVVEFSMNDDRNVPSRFRSYFVSQKSYRTASRSDKLKSALSLLHSPEAVANITRLIRDENPSILHCHNIYHQLTPSIITAAARLGVPVVLTLHDYKPVCPVYTQLSNGKVCTRCADGGFEAILAQRCADGSLGRSSLLWAEARYHALAGSYHRVDKFIAPSRFMYQAIVRRFAADKVVHIPNGIDASRIEVATHDEGYVLYFGRLSAEKGVETLLRAHAADHGAWRLVIAGTGPLLEELQRKYPAAEFKGHLTGVDLARTIAGAALIAVPSEWHENNPLSILEAMAHGKPIVASRIGGIPELVRDGTTGLLVRPGSASHLSEGVRALLADRNRRAALGRSARSIVEAEYSLQAHGAALLSLYESLVGSANSKRVGL
ncbi:MULTISPECIES: glycosyltransferase family 4 protein [unclassified Bradyrhizobium]|uniref:glycosyltransferase family 4 protein n=1 Tax=unclassified Bradyrhizobium TaxID=2631580 RepID=UPI0024787CCA|nr:MULTISPECIES: glycosyltransferase family 4 protein [unclassified Bradyrhizobium]WGR69668.1 glycosyltransferase family 4 protein [Bradyrhizobium sp. ISRA426]WGR81725.1 glycosyltransferase family 4 protein [Bradyrhizobium sp. ISRA430]WGR84910.1 glycosyltransferase family 4 protein [Bradyrhizobium sp. ISRA432]